MSFGLPLKEDEQRLTYGDYLKVNDLIALQKLLSDPPHHDEMLFIVIHQVHELWFKQLLHEIDHLNRMLRENNEARAMHGLNRILTILKVLVAQLDILETMTPLEFLSFRDRLEAGSGFQSWQFRSMEFVLGLKDPRALDRYDDYPAARARLERRLAEPTLWDAFLAHLALNGIPVPAADLGRDVTKRIEPSPAPACPWISAGSTRPRPSRARRWRSTPAIPGWT